MILTDNVGSLYMLKLTEDGVYAASLLSKPIIPKDPSNIEMFKQTLDYLLKMKVYFFMQITRYLPFFLKDISG